VSFVTFFVSFVMNQPASETVSSRPV
jgi:hypothetical protein